MGNNYFNTPPAARYTSLNIRVAGTGAVVLDGDWSVAKASGAPLVTRPFSREGDVISKVVRQPVQQDLRYRQALALGTAYNYPDEPVYTALHGSATLFDETEPRDLGGNLGEWIRSYATIPPTRETPESFNFPYQYYSVKSDGVGNYSFGGLAQYSKQVSSKVKREYFLLKDIDDYPILEPPKFIPVGDGIRKVGDGSLYASTAGYWFSSDDEFIVAEPSTYEIAFFPIYCRRTRYVPAPNDAFWGEFYNITIPPPPSS